MLRSAARAALRAAPSWCAAQRRGLNVHEYQGAELLRAAGVNVPPGVACRTVEEVAAASAQLGGEDGEVVLKSQVLAGGRGLGTFTSGLKGGVHIVKARCQCSSVRGLALTPLCKSRWQTRLRLQHKCLGRRW